MWNFLSFQCLGVVKVAKRRNVLNIFPSLNCAADGFALYKKWKTKTDALADIKRARHDLFGQFVEWTGRLKFKMEKVPVESVFVGKTVFITGASGFLGKVLVEKLLRSCSGVEKIFILIRGKKGKSADERLEDFKTSKAFDNVRQMSPQPLDKLVAIEGDLTLVPLAGISVENIRTLKEDVNFVFHCAANVRFLDPVEQAIRINLIGSRTILDLAETFGKLEAFVHVSTAYSNYGEKVILEKVYEPVCDYMTAIKAVELGDSVQIAAMENLAMKAFANTYNFSKHLTEALVGDKAKKMPICLIRPSIIVSSYREPFPGWVDSINGVTGLFALYTTGLVRAAHFDGRTKYDPIPCDATVNSMIVAAAGVVASKDKSIKVYNCTTGNIFSLTFEGTREFMYNIFEKYPPLKAVWYPYVTFTRIKLLYFIYFFLFQLIPSAFIDLLLFLCREKPFAVKLQKRVFKELQVHASYLKKDWQWKNDNFLKLNHTITDEDRLVGWSLNWWSCNWNFQSIYRENFNVNTGDFHMPEYFENWLLGMNRYILKSDNKHMTFAMWKYRSLYWLHLMVKLSFWSYVVRATYRFILNFNQWWYNRVWYIKKVKRLLNDSAVSINMYEILLPNCGGSHTVSGLAKRGCFHSKHCANFS